MKHARLAVLLLLASCASPEPRYYTLAPVELPRAAMAADAPRRIEILRPSLPAYLDRPEMSAGSGYAVTRDDAHVWAEPLDRMIGRTLALDLGHLLPDSAVATEDAGDGGDAYKIAVEIQSFEPDGPEGSVLIAQVGITGPAGAAVAVGPAMTFHGQPGTPGPAMAASLSGLTGQIAQRLATLLPEAARAER